MDGSLGENRSNSRSYCENFQRRIPSIKNEYMRHIKAEMVLLCVKFEINMKACGIELKGNEAILVCLEGTSDNYAFVKQEVKKIKLLDSNNQNDVKAFSKAIEQFFYNEHFDSIGIKARATKGRFAGGSVSFKMEGIIQLADCKVQVIHGATIKAKMKTRVEDVASAELNSYQKEAFTVALYLLSS